MNKRIIYFITLSIVFVTACGEQEDVSETKPFISKTRIVDGSYPKIDQQAKEIMDKLQICTLNDTVLSIPPCTSDYFRIFQYQTDKSWKDGFIVEMIPGLYGAPFHQIVIIENYLGKYRIVNRYLGALLELRSSENGHDDLLIAYEDPEIGTVAIRHEWQENKYDVVDVEEINNHYIKPEYKDSINNIFLPAFAGGY